MSALQTVMLMTGLWSIAVVAIALLTHRSLGTSGRPADWIPFFFLGPLIVAVVLCVIAILIPMLISGALVASIFQLFGTVLSANRKGLVLTRRISAKQRIVRWAEIEEIVETEEYPVPTACAVLKGGLRIHLSALDSAIRTAIGESGVQIRFIPFDEFGTERELQTKSSISKLDLR